MKLLEAPVLRYPIQMYNCTAPIASYISVAVLNSVLEIT